MSNYTFSQYATAEEQELDRQREAHYAYDCNDDCPYCNEQRCLNCGSDRFERFGDLERCADCGK